MKHEPECVCCAMGDDERQRQENEIIERCGHMIRGVYDVSPRFYYTIGLWEQGLPEIFLSGDFQPEIAMALVNAAAHELKNGPSPQSDHSTMRSQRIR